MAPIIRSAKTRPAGVLIPIIFSFASFFALFSVPALSQIAPSCQAGSTTAIVHAEGLAEQIGDITLTCTGGAPGSLVASSLFITLNTNITNRIDASGNVLNVAVTVNTGAGPVPAGTSITLYSPVTLAVTGVQYTVPSPGTQPVTIRVSDVRAAVADASGGGQLVTGAVAGSGILVSNGQTLVLASGQTSLLDSVVNNGIPCGSPAPATLDFPGLLAAGTYSATIRVTEGYPSAFLPKSPGADTGVRILVKLSGYGSATVYLPDAIVGNTGSTPTSAGAFNSTYSGGAYTPGSNQLLLVRVNNADATGAGGTLVFAAPAVATNFTSVTPITLADGAGYVVYEVVDSNPNSREYAQIPVFLAVPQSNCTSTGLPVLAPELAPVSNVSVATQTDPIPRFIANTPGPDCQQIGDCGAAYFPQLGIAQTAITLNGSSLGGPAIAYDQLVNAGSGQLNYNISIAYQSGANWLSVDPMSGTNNVLLTLTANPASLVPGVYQATATINAGTAGTSTVAVTFNVGPTVPQLQVTQSQIALTGAVSGSPASASINVVNTNPAAGQLTFNVSIAWPAAIPPSVIWLSVSPTSGTTSNATLTVTANPASLAPGIYYATVIINAGGAGIAKVAVTFTVGSTSSQLQVVPSSITLTSSAPTASVNVTNANPGSGSLTFNASIGYPAANQPSVSWLSVSPVSGTTSTTLTLTANPASLTPGVYQATVTINAGSAGIVALPVSLDVVAPVPLIQSIVNGANFQLTPVAPGSFATIFGLSLEAKNSLLVTFNGLPAKVYYDGNTQINVVMPAALGTVTVANAVAVVDGQTSNTFAVTLAPNAPAVFTPGILNQNNSVNLATATASPGDIIQIFLTGLATPIPVPLTVNIGGQIVSNLIYAGLAPGIPGLDQINVEVPVGLTFSGNSVPLSVCIPEFGAQPLCSAAVNLYLSPK